MDIFRIVSIACCSLMLVVHAVTGQEVTLPNQLPSLEEAKALPDTKKLELADQTLFGDVRVLDYGFSLLIEMSRRGNRDAIRLLAKGITNNEYRFRDDIELVLRALGTEAMLGSSSAVMAWAVIHDRGMDVVEDDAAAYEWYRWAAIVGSESGRRETAIALVSGKGVAKNLVEAVQWADRLPPVRRSSAYLAMAEILYTGQQTDDEALADRLTVEAASLEPANAMRAAQLLREYSRSDTAQVTADRILGQAASTGDAKALVLQARLAERSNDPDARSRAVQSLIDLASGGNLDAIKPLARLVSSGSLSTQKIEEVTGVLKQQADAGNVEAILAISRAYMFGTGVSVSFEQAAKYYQMGAEIGNPEAQYQLGMMYAGGIGVPIDIQAARSWLQKSADGGSQVAAATLSSMK